MTPTPKPITKNPAIREICEIVDREVKAYREWAAFDWERQNKEEREQKEKEQAQK